MTVPNDPYAHFSSWYEGARHHEGISYAAACCLSTVAPDGAPDGRILLLHGYDTSGFYFFTDERSPKVEALRHEPRAALTFYWGPMERQVRILGSVSRARSERAEIFFDERPRRSRITAWASRQSQELESPEELEASVAHWDRHFDGAEEVPRPAHWKAYLLKPHRLEFWEARARRLHERILYTRTEDGWSRALLAP